MKIQIIQNECLVTLVVKIGFDATENRPERRERVTDWVGGEGSILLLDDECTDVSDVVAAFFTRSIFFEKGQKGLKGFFREL